MAERTISDDLEFLISQAVDPKKADYAGEAELGGSAAGWGLGTVGAAGQHAGGMLGALHRARHATHHPPHTPPLPSLPCAVITGVQIHNWANNFEDDSPNLEFVAPTAAYVVVNGVKTHVDLSAVPVSSRGGVGFWTGRRRPASLEALACCT